MCKEREDNLIDINVYGHGCMEGLYNCEGRFNTKHVYRVNDLKVFRKNGIDITYGDSCKYVKDLVENNE